MFKRSVTGLVLESSGSVTAVAVTAGLRTREVTRTGFFPGEGDDLFEKWSSAIAAARSLGFPMERIVLGLPAGKVFKRSLDFPFSGRKRIRQVLASQLEGDIPVTADSVVADILITGSSREGASGIAIAGDRELVERAMNLLPEGSELLGVQTDSVGLVSALLSVGVGDGAVLFCAPESPYAVVLSIVANRTEGMRTVFMSGETDIDPLVRAAADGAGEGGDIVLICPRMSETLTDALEGASRHRVRAAGALGLFRQTAGRHEGDSARFVPALGLALAGLGVRGAAVFDLRQGPLSPRNPLMEVKVPLVRTACILAGVMILAGASSVLSYRSARIQYERFEEKLTAAYSDLFPRENVNDAVRQIEQKIRELKERSRTLAGFGGSSVLGILAELSRVVPEDSGLKIVELSLDGERLRFDGTVNSFDAVDRVQEAVEQSGWFDNVQVQNARVAADPSKVTFRLQMEVTGFAQAS